MTNITLTRTDLPLFRRKPDFVYYGLIALLVPIVYYNLFSTGYITDWDDGLILLNNKDVHQFNIRAFFTQHYVGNYAPLTMIGFAIDWLLFKNHAGGQHAISILLHLVNGMLVYRLASLLLQHRAKAFLVALIFCFHPTQVESVAWLAAQNNPICTLFFVTALSNYVRYRQYNKRKYYLQTLLFFVLSILSKPSAICFPLCLPAIDYLLGQPFNWKSLLRMMPFLVIALILGLVTLYTRTQDNFMNPAHSFAWFEKIGYAGYALAFYLYKFLLPINLCVIYPYPEHGAVPIIIGALMILLLLGLASWLLYKHKYRQLGALLFIIINFLLVLQFIPYGEVLTADRYMYIPLIGFGLLLMHTLPLSDKGLQVLAASLFLYYAPLTFTRSDVWKDSIALYSNIVYKYPDSYLGWSSLGAAHMLKGNTSEAYSCLNKAASMSNNFYPTYYNRGLLYSHDGQPDKAISDFDHAIKLKPSVKAYIARGSVFFEQHDLARAIKDANAALEKEPENLKALYLLANCYDEQNKSDDAIMMYNHCIDQNPEEGLYYMRRGIVYGKKGDLKQCLNDLDHTIALKPNSGEPYYWRGIALVQSHQDPCADFKKAKKFGFSHAAKIMNRYCQ